MGEENNIYKGRAIEEKETKITVGVFSRKLIEESRVQGRGLGFNIKGFVKVISY